MFFQRNMLVAVYFALNFTALHGAGAAVDQNVSISKYVYPDSHGKLIYTADELGNVIPDFSNCGYRGGGIALPATKGIANRIILQPAAGDATPRIQAAIDQVSNLPADARGIRGAVLLGKGEYEVAGSIQIRQSGVILRGEGDSPSGTVIIATGRDRRALLILGPSAGREAAPGQEDLAQTPRKWKHRDRHITDIYVPVGAHALNVDDAEGLRVGDNIIVHRPSTENWIRLLGMDQIPPRKDGLRVVQWAAGSKDLYFDRIVTAIDGRKVTIDAPLTCALDRKFGGGDVHLSDAQPRISESGIEHLRGRSEFHGETDENHSWTFISIVNAENVWVRNITAEHFASNAVAINVNTKWITVQDCACLDPVSQITGSRRYSFAINRGQLCLIQRCHAREGRHDFVMSSTVPGPNVFLDCTAEKTHDDAGPHHRWSTGVLYDNLILPDGKINIRNRGNAGSGHGWAGANQVVWNSTAASMIIENPPTAKNYAIGCITKPQGNGIFESLNQRVAPRSLYLAQLSDRLGPQAALNVTLRD